jgi:6-pyruvoyltetrahydropterin/6-carboxytetrahydropterin synthase
MKFQSTKLFKGYSTAFRQWRATSHCNKIHGYSLSFEVTFEAELDERNWVQDFGAFKDNGVKEWLQTMFDHTTVVAKDDPELTYFQEGDRKGILDLRVLPKGVGCEMFAKEVFRYVHKAVQENSNNRVRVIKVRCFEHEENSAIYIP